MWLRRSAGAGDRRRGAVGSPARGCERTWGRAQCPPARVWGVRCAPRLRASGSPGLSVRGCLPPVCCSPQSPPPSPGTKRLRGGAEPAALAGASGDGRAPSSDSSSQPPIRPQETESPCLASSHLLLPDPAPFPVPHALHFPGSHSALSFLPPPFHLGCPGKSADPLGIQLRSLSARVPASAGRCSPGSQPGSGASLGVGVGRGPIQKRRMTGQRQPRRNWPRSKVDRELLDERYCLWAD